MTTLPSPAPRPCCARTASGSCSTTSTAPPITWALAAATEFFGTLRLRGAHRGILATLGTLEPGAAAAAGSSIQLVDGAHLWARVRDFVDPALLASVRGQAAASTRRGLWGGGAASLALGAIAFFALAKLPGTMEVQAAAAPTVNTPPVPAAAATRAAPAEDPVLRQLNATAAAMAEVARLTPEQLAKRRADAARQVGQLPQVESAAWSAQRTLLLALNRTDGKDEGLIAETCRILLQNEEMRYTRIQLNPPPNSPQAVRWRLCE
jgi:restriction system protein